ncbi:MAG: glycosyltransferase family 2 protein [Candidatus Bathyarchaeota archaeon]|nr:glycosyltransferase family 2 protein [Candidatus Bathyarchaeota archaeon]
MTSIMENRPSITVAIVTARETEDTRYSEWSDLYRGILNGSVRKSRAITGELMAVLTGCVLHSVSHHIEYQLRALYHQTMVPDQIIIVSRGQRPEVDSDVAWLEPILSEKEIRDNPLSGCLCHPSFFTIPERRKRNISLGCSDKNTALLFCRSDYLVVLDDCCLPGPGFIEAAYQACEEGKVLLPAHRQLYLPTDSRETVEYSDANVDLQSGHLVMGIWAAPVSYFLDINGWNTDLDGLRGGLDQELKIRMDRYLEMRGKEYALFPSARVYEIQHSYPWGTESSDCWMEKVPPGYLAPGPSLKKMRDSLFDVDLEEDSVDAFIEAFDDAVVKICDDAEEEEKEED